MRKSLMTWTGNDVQLVTTGFSGSGCNEVVLRDIRNIRVPVGSVTLPKCFHTLQPFSANSLLAFAGLGDASFFLMDPLTLSATTVCAQGETPLSCLRDVPFAQNTRQMVLLDARQNPTTFVRLSDPNALQTVTLRPSPVPAHKAIDAWLDASRAASTRLRTGLNQPHLSASVLEEYRDAKSPSQPSSPRSPSHHFNFAPKGSSSSSPLGSPLSSPYASAVIPPLAAIPPSAMSSNAVNSSISSNPVNSAISSNPVNSAMSSNPTPPLSSANPVQLIRTPALRSGSPSPRPMSSSLRNTPCSPGGNLPMLHTGSLPLSLQRNMSTPSSPRDVAFSPPASPVAPQRIQPPPLTKPITKKESSSVVMNLPNASEMHLLRKELVELRKMVEDQTKLIDVGCQGNKSYIDA